MMTEDEKLELRLLLDKHQIKSLYYSEADSKYSGVYYIISRSETGDLLEDEIRVED